MVSTDPRKWFGIGDGAKGLIVALLVVIAIVLIASKRLNISIPVLTPLSEKVVGA